MHLALPARKSSHPAPYATRSSRFPIIRRSRIQTIAIGACVIAAILFIISHMFRGAERIPSGTPPVVIITILDKELYKEEFLDNVKENRLEYAKKHGYATFFPNTADYELGGAPTSWAKVPATQHAMTKFPHSIYFWYLDANSLIMNPALTLEGHIMNPRRLESLMIKDYPVVPPDSVIKTFPHLKGTNVDFVVTQDKEGLAPGSFILRRGDWSRFFLDTWWDPLYRSYNFQKADTHALEHIVQWHPTILSKLALVPQRIINSYNQAVTPEDSGFYKDGDFVIRFSGCEKGGARDCIKEAKLFFDEWRKVFSRQ